MSQILKISVLWFYYCIKSCDNYHKSHNKKQILESQNRKCDSITVLKVVTIITKVTTKKQILESQTRTRITKNSI